MRSPRGRAFSRGVWFLICQAPGAPHCSPIVQVFWPARSLLNAEEEVAERVGEFKRWLLARPESCMAIVGHSAFFASMTGQPKLANCEAYWCTLHDGGLVDGCKPLPLPPGFERDDDKG